MHGAESIVLHQDLIRVGPLFFEQGQHTFGVLSSAQKIPQFTSPRMLNL